MISQEHFISQEVPYLAKQTSEQFVLESGNELLSHADLSKNEIYNLSGGIKEETACSKSICATSEIEIEINASSKDAKINTSKPSGIISTSPLVNKLSLLAKNTTTFIIYLN